jgi:hypothetical protein
MVVSHPHAQPLRVALLALAAAGCVSDDFDRYSMIPREEFERHLLWVPPEIDRNCVLERAPALSVTVGPEAQFFEGGYGESQSLMSRGQRRTTSWYLAQAECPRRPS